MSPNRRDRDTAAIDAKSTPVSSLGQTLWHAFMLSYGVLAGLSWVLLTLKDALLFQRRSSKRVTDKELADARDRLWNLSSHPIPGFTHAFFTTPDDNPITLHYVVSAWDTGPRPNLVVFLHGFPDSWVLWKTYLSQKRNLDPETVYVALDLPGYGGSDSLAKYDAYNVLEAVTSFVLGMRERYGVDGGEDAVSGGGAVGGVGNIGEERGQVVLVSHDWGSAVASRLASEAPQLADHFVIASIVLPRLFLANTQARISSVRRMCHTWTQQPLNFRLLRNSWKTLQPLFSQLRKAHYIFAFNLPELLARLLGSFTGAWFLSKIHRIASYNIPTPTDESAIKEAAEALASSLGPGTEQCRTTLTAPLSPIPEKQALVYDTPTTYPSTVHSRAASLSHAWFQKMRYYRDGLILGQWTKSLQTILSLSVLDSSNSTLVGSSTATSPTSGKFTSPNQSSAKLAEQGSTSATNGISNNNGAHDDGAGGVPFRHRRRRSSAGLYASYASRSRRSSLSVGASLFDAAGSGPRGALRAPATLLVGLKDVAFDWRLGLEGVADHLAKGGAVVVCERAGHWLIREEVGVEVLRRVVGSAVGSEVVIDEGVGGEDGGSGGGAGSVVLVDGGRQGSGAGVMGTGGMKELLRGVEGVKVTVER